MPRRDRSRANARVEERATRVGGRPSRVVGAEVSAQSDPRAPAAHPRGPSTRRPLPPSRAQAPHRARAGRRTRGCRRARSARRSVGSPTRPQTPPGRRARARASPGGARTSPERQVMLRCPIGQRRREQDRLRRLRRLGRALGDRRHERRIRSRREVRPGCSVDQRPGRAPELSYSCRDRTAARVWQRTASRRNSGGYGPSASTALLAPPNPRGRTVSTRPGQLDRVHRTRGTQESRRARGSA